MVMRIENPSLGLPTHWANRITAGNRPLGTLPDVRKLLGEPAPQLANMAALPPHIARMFRRGGLLDRIRRKLGVISRKKGGHFLAAHNTIAAVDPDDNIYVGVEFLEACEGDEAVIAGILAHEWGHMVSELPRDVDWSHLTWEALFALRREEEAGADAYAGRALYQMGYDVQPVIGFLQGLETERRRARRLATVKYYPNATRAAILQEGYAAEQRLEESARKLLTTPGYRHPSFSKLLAVG
ncbi:MAG: hypothetical protein HYV02_06030 [Deltaproteobacteria bacterium]|nr:hypothetical protein [Deltaproteobacteria bacterium]